MCACLCAVHVPFSACHRFFFVRFSAVACEAAAAAVGVSVRLSFVLFLIWLLFPFFPHRKYYYILYISICNFILVAN